MRTPGQVERDLHTVIAAGGPIAECAVGEWLPEVVEANAAYFVAAWNACDRLGLTAEQLEDGALEKLVEAAKVGLAFIPKAKWEYAWQQVADALKPFTEQPNGEAE